MLSGNENRILLEREDKNKDKLVPEHYFQEMGNRANGFGYVFWVSALNLWSCKAQV